MTRARAARVPNSHPFLGITHIRTIVLIGHELVPYMRTHNRSHYLVYLSKFGCCVQCPDQ